MCRFGKVSYIGKNLHTIFVLCIYDNSLRSINVGTGNHFQSFWRFSSLYPSPFPLCPLPWQFIAGKGTVFIVYTRIHPLNIVVVANASD